jgi:hypothetical protein
MCVCARARGGLRTQHEEEAREHRLVPHDGRLRRQELEQRHSDAERCTVLTSTLGDEAKYSPVRLGTKHGTHQYT